MVTLNFGSAPAMASIAASTVFGARRIRTFRGYPDRQLLTDIAQYVESGALRLGAGEAAEFDTREPHLIGSADSHPAEVLTLFSAQGEHAQLSVGRD